jgi:hypothetical protein
MYLKAFMVFAGLELQFFGSLRIINYRHKEDLGSGDFKHDMHDEYDKNRRIVFTHRTKTNDQNDWTLEKVQGIINL